MSRRCSVLTIRRDGHRVPPVRPEIPGTESPSLFRGRTGCWSQAVPQGQRVGSTSTKGPKAQAFRLPGLRSLGRLLSVRFLQQLHVSLADGDPATWIELVIHVSSCLTRNRFPPGSIFRARGRCFTSVESAFNMLICGLQLDSLLLSKHPGQ